MPKRLSDEEAERQLRGCGYTPRVSYPGKVNAKWPSVHDVCGRNADPYLANLKAGKGGCKPCGVEARATRQTIAPHAATDELLGYGYRPVLDYPGANKKWRAVHLRCGEVRNVVLTTLRSGRGCCGRCAAQAVVVARLAAGAEAAIAEMRAAGLDVPGQDVGSGEPG